MPFSIGTCISEALAQIENTARNFQDRNLGKVGIIGEFSCGKSTFLLTVFTQEHLLVDDILRAQHLVPTILNLQKKNFYPSEIQMERQLISKLLPLNCAIC